MKFNNIDTDFIIDVNEHLCEHFDHSHGIRERNLLESIIPGSEQSMFGQDAYPTNRDKITFIVASIIKNHVFIDANKRTAVVVYSHLCEINDMNCLEGDELYNAVQKIAKEPWDIPKYERILFSHIPA